MFCPGWPARFAILCLETSQLLNNGTPLVPTLLGEYLRNEDCNEFSYVREFITQLMAIGIINRDAQWIDRMKTEKKILSIGVNRDTRFAKNADRYSSANLWGRNTE